MEILNLICVTTQFCESDIPRLYEETLLTNEENV